MYAALLSKIGPVKLAVTTSFNANFLYRPEPVNLIAEAGNHQAWQTLGGD